MGKKLIVLALLVTGLIGCSGEKPLSESESMEGVLKDANVNPVGEPKNSGLPKAGDK